MSSEQGYYVRCVTCGDHYWRGADEDDELVCSLCREEQANHEAMRQQQEDPMGYISIAPAGWREWGMVEALRRRIAIKREAARDAR